MRRTLVPARLLAIPVALLLLAGCASETERGAADVRDRVEAVMDAANDRDAAGVRLAVADLLQVLRAQTGKSLTPQEAQAIANAARALADKAGALEASPTPSPTPTQEPSPTPTPEETEEPEEETEEPSPSPRPSRTRPRPTPTPEPEPEETESEEPVEIEVSPPTADGGPSSSPTPTTGTA